MEFKDYYNRENIIKYLCKIRIAYSNKRHKKQLLDNLVQKQNHLPKLNDPYDNEIIRQLELLLPSRRLWLTHNCKRHIKCKNELTGKNELKKIETDDKNRQILYTTIKRHSTNKSKYPYQYELEKFITEIQNGIDKCNYKISPPDIVPEVKETSKSKKKYLIQKNKIFVCRPISRFILMDRIVISLTNKFLTDLLDNHFEKSSLAFRAKDKAESEEKNHHLAINKIIEFKQKNITNNLFVAECDIKKFYDTVNHDLCVRLFEDLAEKSKDACSINSLKSAKYVFKEYLNSYNFEDVVLSKGDAYWDKQFHSNRKRINGVFPWIQKDISENKFYTTNPNQKIGVPQGGALSGLIANIVLDKADKELKAIPDLFYVRYCDDMILMHRDENLCNQSIEIYKKALKELLLFSHPFETVFHSSNKSYSFKNRIIPLFIINRIKDNQLLRKINSKFDYLLKKYFPKFRMRRKKTYNLTFKHSLKKFWACKSKGPYKWGKLDILNRTFPWVGFVGYEIDYSCNTRVRKRSLKKEIDKQKKIITSILKRISKDDFSHKRVRNNAIYRSAFEKLNGMSVGRVKPYNYKTFGNKICWTDGFRSLNFNNYSKIQLKKLDRHKYRYLNALRHKIGSEKVATSEPEFDTKNIYKLGKMFSYYFHAGEKKNNT